NNLANESDIGMLQRLQMRSVAAADRYGDPANRDDLLATMADHARLVVEQTEPGSDAQLAWVRHWATCARGGTQRDAVRAVLDGTFTVAGLEVDTDLRWHLVTALAHAGAADDELINAELARDPTDVGQRNARAARAARPDADDKAEAWNSLASDHRQSHTVARTVAGAWNQMDQPELLAPYASKYLEALETVWEQRSVGAAIDFAEQVFPHPAASRELLAQVRTHLDGDVPAPLRRVLLEEADSLERTLKARELDAAQRA
ncbi:MAG TPA: ERAP1-like C-terminal domain-containing protein, partial [Nitriliruptorales bacterium]